jgi:hypothetical protein
MQCVGIKKDGVRCNVLVLGETQHTRCGTHMATRNKVGPNQIRRDELKYVHIKHAYTVASNFRFLLVNPANTPVERQRIIRLRQAGLREEDIRYQLELNALEETITRETDENGGQDADEPYRQRAANLRRQRFLDARERQERRHEQWNAMHAPAPAPAGGQLQQFAHDPQNVHTAMVVQQVKENVQKILAIPVPADFQHTQKTLGEIITECNIPDAATLQMSVKYCSSDDIYELGHGIYRRVLNGVWQYIKTSPHSEDLKYILRVEMTDNIGMCAQGNLSRLCNILSGYLDGINTDTRSKNEIIGERFAALLKLESHMEKVAEGVRILQEFNVPQEEHEDWLQPLIDA